MPTEPELRLLPISQVRPWPGNPRKTFDEAALAELAASIRAKGVLQPILVRLGAPGKHGTDRSLYEVAAGERRLRAAKQAGLTEIPALVRELTDQEMLEAAVLENEKRQDVTPLERAEGYHRLLTEHGVALEDLASKLGRSVHAIQDLLRLRRLPAKAAAALAAGTIGLRVAQLIALPPSEPLRAKVAAYALAPQFTGGGGPELPGVRQVQDWMGRECLRDLRQAPFDPKADWDASSRIHGACTTCPFRTGNNRAEYPDGSASLCTDPACYQAKVSAWQDQEVARARAKGQKVLPAQEAGALFPYSSTLHYSAPYKDLADTEYDPQTRKTRSYKQLLAGKIAERDVVLARDKEGQLHRLVRKEVIQRVLKKQKPDNSRADREAARRAQAERQKRENGRRAGLLAQARVADRAEQIAHGIAGWTPEMVTLLRALARSLAEIVWYDAARSVLRRRSQSTGQNPAFEAKNGRRQRETERLADLAAKLDNAPALMGFLAELVAARESLLWKSPYYGQEKEEKAFWSAFGLDRSKLLKEVAAERSKNGQQPTAAAPAASAKPITRDTWLLDLLTGQNVVGAGNALEAWTGQRPATVETLLARIGGADRGSYTSKVYSYLRAIPHLGLGPAQQIGDRLVDAGFVTPDGPRMDPSPQTPQETPRRKARSPAGKAKAEEKSPAHAAAGVCKVCGCTESNWQRCVERTGEPCSWASPAKDLCTACLPILNAELTTLPGLDEITVKRINESTIYRHVRDVWGKKLDELTDLAIGRGIRSRVLAAVHQYITDHLGKTTDGGLATSDAQLNAALEERPAPPPSEAWQDKPLNTLGGLTVGDRRLLVRHGVTTLGELAARIRQIRLIEPIVPGASDRLTARCRQAVEALEANSQRVAIRP